MGMPYWEDGGAVRMSAEPIPGKESPRGFKGVGCNCHPEDTGHGTLCQRYTPQVIQGWGLLLSGMRDPWKIVRGM